ncbi:hypothetical protein BH11BAC7_BH11BAC7_00260 [soil metagenome]
MKKFLTVFVLFLITSCSRNLFLPSAVYAPQLRDKHEAELGVNGNATSGVQAQGAFAIGENFGVQAQANYIGKNGGNILGGINYWFKIEPDSQNTFLIGFSAGYSGGTYKRYVTRAAVNGIPGVELSPGYMLYDIYGRWHGGYFQYSLGVRLGNRFAFYTGTRIQWLNCEKFNYQSQYFARDSSGNVIPGEIRTIDRSHAFTTTADVYLGFSFGWEHFHIYLQGQKHYQYNAVNLNDDWRKFGQGVLTAGFSYTFHKRK